MQVRAHERVLTTTV